MNLATQECRYELISHLTFFLNSIFDTIIYSYHTHFSTYTFLTYYFYRILLTNTYNSPRSMPHYLSFMTKFTQPLDSSDNKNTAVRIKKGG